MARRSRQAGAATLMTTGRIRGHRHPRTPVWGPCLSNAPSDTWQDLGSPGSTLTPMTGLNSGMNALFDQVQEADCLEQYVDQDISDAVESRPKEELADRQPAVCRQGPNAMNSGFGLVVAANKPQAAEAARWGHSSITAGGPHSPDTQSISYSAPAASASSKVPYHGQASAQSVNCSQSWGCPSTSVKTNPWGTSTASCSTGW